MNDSNILDKPEIHSEIRRKSEEIRFTMSSDLYIGTLLKPLISSKPKGKFLELGTRIGPCLSWMIDALGVHTALVIGTNDVEFTAIARQYDGKNERVEIV